MKQIGDLQKQLPSSEQVLTAANLSKLGEARDMPNLEEDQMTEFSILSTESQIMPSENVLDIRVCEINFSRELINQTLGMRDALPNAIKTFVTLDFFNHDTKHTDLITGYDPQFDFIFSFKNQVDDFYLKYLSEEAILVEVFSVRSSGNKVTEKIGEAKLPLIILLQNDQGFQT